MLNLSFALSQLKDAVLRRPVEIHDIYLGSQTSEDTNTLHFANYYRQINFFTYLGSIGQSYQALGVSRGAIKKGSKGEIDRVNYKIDNVNRQMSEYAAAIDFRNKRIVTRLVYRDYLDDAANAKVVFDGTIQSILFERSSIAATCVPIISSLDFETGWAYQINCSAIFGDQFCQVDKNNGVNLVSGTATGGTTATLIDTVNLTQADNYWNIGTLVMNSGANSGAKRRVIDFDQATGKITVDYEFNSNIEAGDTYSVFRGCDKRRATCRDVYNNEANYHGFHAIPLNESNL